MQEGAKLVSNDHQDRVIVKCYGAGSGAVERALQKVADRGLLKCSLALVFDSGDLAQLYEGFCRLLSDLKGKDERPLAIVHYPQSPSVSQQVKSPHVHVLKKWPLDLGELAEIACGGLQVSALRGELLDLTLYLASQLRESRMLSAMPGHGAAVQKLWAARNIASNADAAVPLCVVVVDDDADYLLWAKECFGAAFQDVLTYSSIEEYFSAQESGDALPPQSVDLFLLDIVSRESSTGQLDLTGFERALPVLNRARGLQVFPQIFMLSSIPRPLIAHLCHKVGADYYLVKSDLRCDPDPCGSLLRILDHIDRSSRDLPAPPLPPKSVRKLWRGWEVVEESDFRLIWNLYSKVWKITRIDQIKRLDKGKSEAKVFAVNVWKDEYQAPIAPRIVKIDTSEKVAQEWTAFQSHIAALMTHSFGRVEPMYSKGDRDAAISLALAGSPADFSNDRLVDCKEMIEDPSREVSSLAKHIFSGLLSPLHNMDCGTRPMCGVLEFMASELEPVPTDIGELGKGPLCGEICKVKGDEGGSKEVHFRYISSKRLCFPTYVTPWPSGATSPIWRVRAGKHFKFALPAPDHNTAPARRLVLPSEAVERQFEKQRDALMKGDKGYVIAPIGLLIQHLRSHTEKVFDLERFLSQLDVETSELQFGVVHGDINLRNVLGSESSGSLWLIDFANTRPGIPALDFVTFEAEVRLQIILPRLAVQMKRIIAPSSEIWFKSARELLESFETSTQDYSRVDMDTVRKDLWPKHSDRERNEDRAIIKRAWQEIMSTRAIAFEALYRGKEGRRVYETIFALFMIRVLQKYKTELFSGDGPLGTLWAAVALEKCMERLHDSGGFDHD